MTEKKTKTARPLTADEIPALTKAREKLADAKGKLRSAGQSIESFEDFCTESAIRLTALKDGSDEKKTLEGRVTHCKTIQIPQAETDAKVAGDLIKNATAAHDKAFAEAKKKHPTLREENGMYLIDEEK